MSKRRVKKKKKVKKKRKEVTKDFFLQVRITEKEKKEVWQDAENNGFDEISAYILWLTRAHRKSKKT